MSPPSGPADLLLLHLAASRTLAADALQADAAKPLMSLLLQSCPQQQHQVLNLRQNRLTHRPEVYWLGFQLVLGP